jgi:Mg-chelatase subunit ChlD
MNKFTRCLLTLGMLAIGWLATSALAHAQAGYSVTLAQVDAGRYPIITLYVNVRDVAGQPVGGLRKEDFSVTEDGAAVEITDFAGTGDPRPVDIVFVFDTTNSMREEIEGVKATCISFAQKLKEKKRDYRLGLVAFGDEIRGVYKSNGELTDNAEEFKGWIGTLRAIGGDGTPENDYAALKQASQMKFRDKAQKILILITDAPPHHYRDAPDGGFRFDDPDLTVDRATAILKEKAITLYAITYDHPDFRKLVEETNGEFYKLTPTTDFTGIIDKLGTTIAQQYRISYRSPRPVYDGTRRNIAVSVGGVPGAPGDSSKGGGAYVEPHLVNFRSNIWVALAFLLPLLLAAAAPMPFLFWKRHAAVPASTACAFCGQPLRPQARFCRVCGKPVAQPSSSAAPSSMSPCPRCGAALRAGAHFCPRCGARR